MASIPRLLVAGPLLGSNPGWVVSQGEILAQRFSAEGENVLQTSGIPNRALRLADTLRALWRWRSSYDLVLLMVFSGPAFSVADLTSRMAALLRKPVIMWLHGGALPEFAARRPELVKKVLRRGAGIVSPSPYLASLVGQMGLPARVIPNLLQVAYPFRQRERLEPRLLWMRTFHDLYHPEMAVEVLAKLRENHPDATMTMAGQDRGLQQRVKDYGASFNLNGALRLPGFLGSQEKAAAFAAHDIYINTNRVDNTPVSLIEAASAGLPVVATRVGGIPYLLEDQRQALLVDDGDSAGMTAAIERLLCEPALAARLSRAGYDLAGQSRWENVRAAWLRLFEEVR